MTYDAPTRLHLPDDAKARWTADFERDGLPIYSSDNFLDLDPHEQRLARREWIAFGTGPRALYAQRMAEFERIVAGPLADLAALS